MNNVRLVVVFVGCGLSLVAKADQPSLNQLAGRTDLNIRFIDSFEVMRLSKGGQDAQKELEKQRNELAGDLQKDDKKLKDAITDLQAKAAELQTKVKSGILDQAAVDKEQQKLVKMERDLKTKETELQAKAQEYEQTIKLSMQRMTEKLARDVEEAVAACAKERSYDAVADTMTGRVIYVADKVNITGDIITKVNVKHNQLAQSKTPQAAKTPKATA